MLPGMLCRSAQRKRYQRQMRHANEVMDRLRREDPAAWHEYLSELRTFDTGTAVDGLCGAAADWPEYNGAA